MENQQATQTSSSQALVRFPLPFSSHWIGERNDHRSMACDDNHDAPTYNISCSYQDIGAIKSTRLEHFFPATERSSVFGFM